MPNKSPSQEPHHLDLTERERELERDTWKVTVNNWQEFGTPVATFGKRYDDAGWVGTAELSIEDGMAVFKLELVADVTELYRCVECGLVPERPTTDNPSWCITCMKKVCSKCVRKHRQRCRTKPIKTIGGDEIPF